MANLTSLTVNDTGYIKLPSGTTAQRPESPVTGMIRYNTDTDVTECYTGSSWINIMKQLNLGLYSFAPANSAQEILDNIPSSPSGVYWINNNGTPQQVYCDMTSDGGGWMLYSSFSSDNPYDTTNYPAISGNRLLYTNLSNYGWSLTNVTNWHDGVNANLSTYTRRSQFLAHFYSGTGGSNLILSTFNFSGAISRIRVRFGQGSTNYNTSDCNIIVNNSTVRSGASGYNDITASYDFNPSGSTPLFNCQETGIAGMSWIFVR